MKKLMIGIAALFLLVPGTTFAATFRNAGQDQQAVHVTKEETINDDVYIAGGDVFVDGTVDGDLVAAGGTVTVNGTVNGSVMAAGGTITINGTVKKSVRAAGGTVLINGTIGKDALLAGGTLQVGEKADITGDVAYAGGGTDTVINPLAKIGGKVLHPPMPTASEQQAAQQGELVSKLIALAVTFILAWLFAYFFAGKAGAVALDWRTHFGRSLLWGIVWVVAAPLAAALLFVTVVGIPLGLLLLVLYGVTLFIGYLAGIIALGLTIVRLWQKEMTTTTWLTLLFGVLIMAVLGHIPVIGGFIWLFVTLAGIGAVMHFNWLLLQELRHSKRI